MKLCLSHRREAGLSRLEVVVIIAIVTVLAAVLLPALAAAKKKSAKLGCTNNLKQIVLAYRIWEGDNGDIVPMGISVTNGGSMEMVATGDVVQTFMVMSNELSTPKILICPNDPTRTPATDFVGLSNSNISYFINLDATNNANAQMVMVGDCNFELRGVPVKSGLLLWTNDPVAWSPTRHVRSGNLGLADGSVQSVTSLSLRMYFLNTGVATNRLAIP